MIFNPKKILTDKKYCEQLFYYYFKNKILVKTDVNFTRSVTQILQEETADFVNKIKFLLDEK